MSKMHLDRTDDPECPWCKLDEERQYSERMLAAYQEAHRQAMENGAAYHALAFRLGALQKAIEADLSDAKAVCGGDGEGCSTYRDYYDSAERRHRKCGTCPMDALFHVRAALNPLRTVTRLRRKNAMDDTDAKIYPCEDCGKMRSKNEGGTVFTVCDECWDKHYNKLRESLNPLPKGNGDRNELAD